MRQNEKLKLTDLVAVWEWSQDVSGPAAKARWDCARELIDTFDLADDDLAHSRAWHITKLAGLEVYGDDGEVSPQFDLVYDYLNDFMEENGYQALIDEIEEVGLPTLVERAAKGDGAKLAVG